MEQIIGRLFLNSTYIHGIITRRCFHRWIFAGKFQLPLPSVKTHFSRITTVPAIKKFTESTDSRRSLHLCSKLCVSTSGESKDDTQSGENPESGRNQISIRLRNLFGIKSPQYSLLTLCGIRMYNSCVAEVDSEYFFRILDLPDTFHSWFLVMQLHVWMCLVRLKSEGKDGQVVYNEIVRTMWKDVSERMKLMGEINTTVRGKSLRELHDQFNGLIMAYDVGLLSDDHVLAAALWRNFMQNKDQVNIVALEKIVHYVRKQIHCLEQTDTSTLFESGVLEWGDPRQILEMEITNDTQEVDAKL